MKYGELQFRKIWGHFVCEIDAYYAVSLCGDAVCKCFDLPKATGKFLLKAYDSPQKGRRGCWVLMNKDALGDQWRLRASKCKSTKLVSREFLEAGGIEPEDNVWFWVTVQPSGGPRRLATAH